MVRRLFISAAFAVLAAAPLAARAQSSPVAVGADLGTPGIGGEVQFHAASALTLRADGDWLRFSRNETYSGVPYRGRLRSTTAGVFADWHPMQGAFLVSAGGYFGDRKIVLSSRPSAPVTVGGVTVTPAEIGSLQGQVRLSRAEPFVGLGWDNTFVGDHAWGFRALAGLSFSGSPRVTLASVGGSLSADPTVQAALQREQSTIAHDARNWRYYPVLQIGLTHRF